MKVSFYNFSDPGYVRLAATSDSVIRNALSAQELGTGMILKDVLRELNSLGMESLLQDVDGQPQYLVASFAVQLDDHVLLIFVSPCGLAIRDWHDLSMHLADVTTSGWVDHVRI